MTTSTDLGGTATRSSGGCSGLDGYLATREDRCTHGYAPEQGCTACGLAAKSRGQSIATTAHPEDRAKVEAAIRQLAASGKPFSANEARLIHGVRGGVVGATFTALKNEGVIRPLGDVTSTDKGTHGHRIFEWVAA